MSHLVATSGTVALWDFDEASGLTVADSTAGARDLTTDGTTPANEIFPDVLWPGEYGRRLGIDYDTYGSAPPEWGVRAYRAGDNTFRDYLRQTNLTIFLDVTVPAGGFSSPQNVLLYCGTGSPTHVADSDATLLKIQTNAESISVHWWTSSGDEVIVDAYHRFPGDEEAFEERLGLHVVFVETSPGNRKVLMYLGGSLIHESGSYAAPAATIGTLSDIYLCREEPDPPTVPPPVKPGWGAAIWWGLQIWDRALSLSEIQNSSPSFSGNLSPRCMALWHWIEIDGIPSGYGNFEATSGLFAGRAARERREIVKAWSCDVPSGADQKVNILDGSASIGQLEMKILDPNEDLTGEIGLGVARVDLLLTLSPQMTEVETTSFDVIVNPSTLTGGDDAYPTGGGVIWIGQEAIKYASRSGSTFSTLTRGYYGSRAEFHANLSVVSHYPRSLAQREARIYYFLGHRPPSTPADDAQKIIRMQGCVTSAAQDSTCAAIDVKVESSDRKVSGWVGIGRKRKLFAKAWKTKLRLAMPSPAMNFGFPPSDGDQEYTTALATPALPSVPALYLLTDAFIDVEGGVAAGRNVFSYTGGLADWVKNTAGRPKFFWFVRIENEFLLLSRENPSNTETTIDVVKRGLWGSIAKEHPIGSDVVEVMPVMWNDDAGTNEGDELNYLPWTSDHPIDIALQLITSTGEGTNGPWDTLPSSWGMGVPVGFIDLDEIARTRDEYMPGVRGQTVIVGEDGFDLRDWLQKEVFKVFGLFPVTKLGGKYTIRALTPPLPMSPGTEWSTEHLIEVPKLDFNSESVIGRVIYKYSKNPASGSYARLSIEEFTEAQDLYSDVFGEVTIESSLLHDGNSAQARRFEFQPPVAGQGGGDAWARSRIEWWNSLFSRPPPAVSARTSWEQIEREPGDIIRLTFDNSANVQRGELGLSSASFVITNKDPNDAEGWVRWDLIQLGAASDSLRHISPSLRVVDWDSGTKQLTVNADEFAASGATSLVWNGVAMWAAGYGVRIASEDLDSYTNPVTIASISGNIITLSAVPGGSHTITANDVLLFADYDDQSAEQKARFASLADDQRLLGSADDQAHEHVP